MTLSIDIENIGGIRDGSATLTDGVNATRASNWKGKSSFIKAIKTAMGTATPLTEGAQCGRVELEFDGDPVEVELRRTGRSVSQTGEPYLDDERDKICAELFAFLDETNDVRRAVRNGDPLESILTRPLEFENIDERIADRKHERERLDRELKRARTAENRVRTLEGRVGELESDLETQRRERDELGTEAETTDGAREELSDVRAERSQVESLISRLESTIERTRTQLTEHYEELESLTIPPKPDADDDLDDIAERLATLRRDKDLLESLYSANNRILREGRTDLLGEHGHGMLEDSHECWVCGSQTTDGDIENQLGHLEGKLDEIEDAIDEQESRRVALENERNERKRLLERQEELEREGERLEDTLSDRESSLTGARERFEILSEREAELASAVDDIDDRRSEIESEIKYLETELAEAREELEEARSTASQRESLESTREEVTEELQSLRGRKDRIRREMREQFDEEINRIVSLFETSYQSAHLTGSFDLVVARDGREAPLDALSEGEVELLGIAVALAGYEAYDVEDVVPTVLLDSLGALSDENLQTLVEYLSGRATFLVVTAYPENTGIVGREIDPTEWDVVSANVGPSASSA